MEEISRLKHQMSSMWYVSSASGFIYGWRSFILIIFSSTEYVILGANQVPCECWAVGVLHLFLTLRTSSTQKEDWQKENARGATTKKTRMHKNIRNSWEYHSYMRIAMAIIFPRSFLLPVCRYQYNTAIHPFFYRSCH
jgi:hypothetical protein